MECQDCQSLFSALATATKQHIKAIGQLKLAALQHDYLRMQYLHQEVRALEAACEQTVNAYRRHRQVHEIRHAAGVLP
jgi:hypothetical protein